MGENLRGEKDFGQDLLHSILNNGIASTSSQSGTTAANLFDSRVAGRRLQLANIDRARPVPPVGSLGHYQIQKRDNRLIKKARRNVKKGPPPTKQKQLQLSRRERQRLGFEKIDKSITYDKLVSIHQLWLDYIHRLLGFIDENGSVQSNQVQVTGASNEVHDKQVTLNANAVNAFQTSLVKADLCGAPLRGRWFGADSQRIANI